MDGSAEVGCLRSVRVMELGVVMLTGPAIALRLEYLGRMRVASLRKNEQIARAGWD